MAFFSSKIFVLAAPVGYPPKRPVNMAKEQDPGSLNSFLLMVLSILGIFPCMETSNNISEKTMNKNKDGINKSVQKVNPFFMPENILL